MLVPQFFLSSVYFLSAKDLSQLDFSFPLTMMFFSSPSVICVVGFILKPAEDLKRQEANFIENVRSGSHCDERNQRNTVKYFVWAALLLNSNNVHIY